MKQIFIVLLYALGIGLWAIVICGVIPMIIKDIPEIINSWRPIIEKARKYFITK